MTHTLEFFEAHTEYPTAIAAMRADLATILDDAPLAARGFGTRSRLTLVIQLLDRGAQAFLELVSDVASQNAYQALLVDIVANAWQEYVGWPILATQPASGDAMSALAEIEARGPHWISEGYQRLAKLAQEESGRETRNFTVTSLKVAKWEDIEISFLSDFVIEIRNGDSRETRNYNELGFVDRRTQKPNSSWGVLRDLAERAGRLPKPDRLSRPWSGTEKRIERLRKRLREYFGLAEDPLPLTDGYRTRFFIDCKPSYRQ